MEEDLDSEDQVRRLDVVVGEGGMEFLPRMQLIPVPMSPSPIIL